MTQPTRDVIAVLERAARDGQSWVDADVAARIAAGAAAATGAVARARASAPPVGAAGPDAVPARAEDAGRALLDVLESLARDDA